MLLQILDEGSITDAHGRHINFKNTIIVLTSNIGADKLVKDTNVGFMNSPTNTADSVSDEIDHLLKPEFINRLDETVIFDKLSPEDLRNV